MRIDVVTIFPEMFPAILGSSILKRAIASQKVIVKVHDLRHWSPDKKHFKVDDRPYGGGPGMVMRPEPFFDAVKAITRSRRSKSSSSQSRVRVILMTPQGEKFTQKTARRLAQEEQVVLLCGHYGGVDERVRETLVDEEISVGDYVLTGGELPALVIVDAVARLIPGVLGDETSKDDESFSKSLLEYPHYTRPREFRGMKVPELLLSGDARAIAAWRQTSAWERTRRRRPDLVKAYLGGSNGKQSRKNRVD
ncbi:MAG: tRNA (guanosine(37)-N1)-methyltransferase TrmD [Candidatus Omnitrophica bacterium]|nr:tRNA (guanosine(37)-N1)-methyltransferase TrmD [Candidatus Omnitrophota bacterium]